MGRKKKNARHSVHGRKIHVNKYINQCGKTKKCRKSAVSWRPASKETPFNDMPTYQWPTVRTPKQYEVWFAELGDHSGTSVQSGTRPVLVISNDVANRNSPVITVIPLSSKLKKLELPVHIVLTEKECEMLRDEHLEDSILLVEQNAQMALSVADRAYVLETGRVVMEGTGAELLTNERGRSAYVGG